MKTSSNGFTLIGVILAAGMTGSLSLLLAQMSRQQLVTQKKAETGAEIIQTTSRISRMLQNNAACVNTLTSGTGSLTINNGGTIGLTDLRDKNNNAFMSAGTTYSNGLIQLSNIAVKNVTLNNTTGKLDVTVTLRKASPAIKGQKNVVKTFPLAVEVDSSNRLIRCRSHLQAAVSAAKKTLCMEMGGTYNTNTLSCTSALANKQCPSGEYIVGFEDDMGLKCQHFAASSGHVRHPPGYNCFLQATYNNTANLTDHYSPSNSWFKIMLLNEAIWKWRVKNSCGTYFCRHQISDCPPSHASKYRRVSISSGNRFDLMLHYCCQ